MTTEKGERPAGASTPELENRKVGRFKSGNQNIRQALEALVPIR
jgi:hypothetical protein